MSSPPVHSPVRPRSVAVMGPRQGAPGRDLLTRRAAPHAAPHAVVLRGLGPLRGQGPLSPTLLAHTEDDFITALQAELAEPDGLQRVAQGMAALPRDTAGHLKLFPPVQRVHQLVLVEACCAEPGFPRLDPRRIESAGLVLRRPAEPGRQASSAESGWLGWMRRREQPLGWLPLQSRPGPHGIGELEDPEAARRSPLALSGHPHIDAQLLARGEQRRGTGPAASERVVPLHPLPEALCARLGRTLLVAYLPVASDEVVAGDEPGREPASAEDLAALQAHLMHYLRAGGLKPLPRPGEPVHPGWLEAVAQAPAGTGEVAGAPAAGRWVQTLMQMHLEWDLAASDPGAAALHQAFAGYRVVRVSASARAAAGTLEVAWVETLCRMAAAWEPAAVDPGSPPATALIAAWRAAGRPTALGLPAELEGTAVLRARQFLAGVQVAAALPFVQQALDALLGDDPPATAVVQPDYWAPVSAASETALLQAASERIRQREAQLFSGSGKRLAEPGVPMALRCFVRLKAPEGCPAQLAWSACSELFSVAPWWESGPARPRVVDMPDPFDRGLLRRLKPGIGFAMPGRLGQLMTPANLDKLKDGNKPAEGGGLGLDWICGFNIPIITLCALIVLNIFLMLFNLIFWWLPFIKICLPIPARRKP